MVVTMFVMVGTMFQEEEVINVGQLCGWILLSIFPVVNTIILGMSVYALITSLNFNNPFYKPPK